MSDELRMADGLSHSGDEFLVRPLGKPFDSRFVSAEKLVSDFLYRRVSSEIVVFGEAGRISKELAERALSNKVIVPGRTTLEDAAWWIKDRLEASNGRIIRPGDFIMIDWDVGLMGNHTDKKRIAYVLKPGTGMITASHSVGSRGHGI